MPYKRANRVAAVIKEEISQILLREIHDPDLGFVTITGVRLSNDLRHAKVFYSVLGDQGRRDETRSALERSLKFIRSEVGQRVRLRFVPTLQFVYDDSTEYADKINRLLKRIRQETGERTSEE